MSGNGLPFNHSKNSDEEEFDINGEIVLLRTHLEDVPGITGYSSTIANSLLEETLQKLYLQLLSTESIDQEAGEGEKGEEISISLDDTKDEYTRYNITFKWKVGLGEPGALLVKNAYAREFFLKSLTLFAVPGRLPDLRFFCNSWIFPFYLFDKGPRVFFSTKSHLPEETPAGLITLREQELSILRGSGSGERKFWDRVYDYDVYNDLGNPDKDSSLHRQVLGRSHQFPYPRRCRTGRPPTKTDSNSESLTDAPFFIPPDEKLPHIIDSDYRADSVRKFPKQVLPPQKSDDLFFSSLEEVKAVYGFLDFPIPQVFKADEFAWMTDEEFARQALSGMNPMAIQCLQRFPPSSNLDAELHGPQESFISAQHIEQNMDGLSVEQAVAGKRLFVLDYYDAYMPYIERINNQSDYHKMYASRILFFLTDQGILRPVAIELGLPPISDNEFERNVYTPAHEGVEGALWLLAKAHASVNDAGHHQLISHWLRTHAVIEPFIIATHRQLSKMHPLHKLLLPHYTGTMEINASARQALINADGIIEAGFTPYKYAIELSSNVYKHWKLSEQGLPADLIKRGMAVEDSTAPYGLRLVIEDYPYAVDGLEIWAALKQWVSNYMSLYYKSDDAIKEDTEVQAWWKEAMNVGHGDLRLRNESGWYQIDSVAEAVEAITTIIWVASAHHAAVNFGQYAYGGYMPNLPSMSSRLIPKKGSSEFLEMVNDQEAYLLKSVSNKIQAVKVMTILRLLSTHSTDEVYLGQVTGSTPDWNGDEGIPDVFARFTSALVTLEKNVTLRNKDPALKNRYGPAQVPYTLLYPSTSDHSNAGGLTGMGVPNSVSI